ncbi:hypothetical protein PROFUN_15773 [Planoprotostelium fungivorum]|uniref:Uncharacterized protein n=1 Tax=Planoprotostelium fungivorum TaxID=1890364 RepID=A0A2P6MQ14_9EUKA|nr:hypothetical protein PROFUN_15773 [Planoprotostelium fungivorum]
MSLSQYYQESPCQGHHYHYYFPCQGHHYYYYFPCQGHHYYYYFPCQGHHYTLVCHQQLSLARVITTIQHTSKEEEEKVSENSATKKHIQCMFIEKEHLGFLWFEIILYKQRLIELFGSYVVTIHHKAQRITYQWFLDLDIPKPSTISMIITSSLPHTGPSIAKGCSLTGSRTRGSRVRVLDVTATP